MFASPRVMYRWVTPNGVAVAAVLQGVQMTTAGPRAVYLARVDGGEQVEKQTFACAVRIVEKWLKVNGISATAVSG